MYQYGACEAASCSKFLCSHAKPCFHAGGDRLIPTRANFTEPAAKFTPSPLTISSSDSDSSYRTKCLKTNYKAVVLENARLCSEPHRGLLQFTPANVELKTLCEGLQTTYERAKENVESVKVNLRHVPKKAERVLDAPGLIDDYYFNPLDWGYNDSLLICLGPALYLYNVITGSITRLINCCKHSTLTSVAWSPAGPLLAAGTSDSNTLLWDADAGKEVSCFQSHYGRVTAITWNPFKAQIFATGGKDGNIFYYDTRTIEKPIFTIAKAHLQEVCGLKWSPIGDKLASGGNDNTFCIWETGTAEPTWRCKEHIAAVKAIAWAEWKWGILATGGGTADKTVRVWDVMKKECEHIIKANSQVSSLHFNPKHKELISSHGFYENQITIWSYPKFQKIIDLKGHKARILATALSPDGNMLASIGADETLRLWRINEGGEHKGKGKLNAAWQINCVR